MGKKRGSNKAELLRRLDSCTRPACFISDDLRILYANPAFFRWLQITPEQLEGVTLDRPDDPLLHGKLRELMPPASIAAGISTAASIRLPGTPRDAIVRFVPCGDHEQPGNLTLAILSSPIDQLGRTAELDLQHIEDELRQLRRRIPNLESLVPLLGEAPEVRRARDRVRLAAATDANCLLCGRPGSGGRLIARSIHAASANADAPFVVVEASLMDPELLEVTLARAMGELEEDENATLACLLADVDEMELPAQQTLRNLLQAHEKQIRLFSTARTEVTQLATDTFDPELAYLLTSLIIDIPSLAERPEDIKLMVGQLLGTKQRGGAQAATFARETIDLMTRYPWPGEFAELESAVRHAAAASRSGIIEINHLPLNIRTYEPTTSGDDEQESIQLDDYLLTVERELIHRALGRADGNRARAARLLGISRSRLLRRVDDPSPRTETE